MDTIVNFFITKVWKSAYFHAWVLAQVRHIITAGGTALVMHGFADQGIVECLVGSGVALAGFYLAHLDVKLVDGKIKIALLTTVETTSVEVKELPPIEGGK